MQETIGADQQLRIIATKLRIIATKLRIIATKKAGHLDKHERRPRRASLLWSSNSSAARRKLPRLSRLLCIPSCLRSLQRISLVTQELGVDAAERAVALWLRLLDAYRVEWRDHVSSSCNRAIFAKHGQTNAAV